MSRFLLRSFVVSSLLINSVLSSAPVYSLPRDKVYDFFKEVAVFYSSDSESGKPLALKVSDGSVEVSYFLSYSAAVKDLQALPLEILNRYKPRITASTLNTILSRHYEASRLMQGDEGSSSLELSIKPYQGDVEAAKILLRESGMSNEQIKDYLRVPVFYTEPPTVYFQNPDGEEAQVEPKTLIFLSFEDMNNVVKTSNVGEVQLKAGDLNDVIDMLMNSKNENFAVYPTKDYIKVMGRIRQSRKKN